MASLDCRSSRFHGWKYCSSSHAKWTKRLLLSSEWDRVGKVPAAGVGGISSGAEGVWSTWKAPVGESLSRLPASTVLKPFQSSMELHTFEKHLLLCYWALEHPVAMQLDLSIMSRADLVNHSQAGPATIQREMKRRVQD